jgi:hypothetical protein
MIESDPKKRPTVLEILSNDLLPPKYFYFNQTIVIILIKKLIVYTKRFKSKI